MDAKEYLMRKSGRKAGQMKWTWMFETDALAEYLESYHQIKSKEEAEERFNKAVEDYFNTDSTKTVHENLHWAAFGKEEEG